MSEPASKLAASPSDRQIAAAAFVLTLAVYGLTSAQHVLGGDSGEFATLAATGGVAHPPGYPLYILLLRALRWLPAVEPAHRASLITALIGSANGALFYRACRAWTASQIASVIATVTFMFAPLTWQLATCPEVFTLNVSIALALVTLAAKTPDDPRAALRHAAALALLAGLGISNHHSSVLLAPIGLFAWFAAARASKRPLAAVAASIAALFVGLLPYGYLVYAARTFDPTTTMILGDTKDLAGLLHHFLRREYGTFSLGISGGSDDTPEMGAHLGAFLRASVVSLRGVPLLALAGVASAITRKGRRLVFRFRWFMLLTAVVVSGPLFFTGFNVPPRGSSALTVERFYLLPWAVLLVACARALDGLAVPALQRWRWAAPAVIVPAWMFAGFDAVREHHRPTVSQYMHNVLALVEPNAILLGSGDGRHGAFHYARLALGERRDVAFVNARLMLAPWYPAHAEALVGRLLPHLESVHGAGESDSYDAGRLLSELLATHRPTYFTDFVYDGYRDTVASYPIGPVMRVVEPDGFMPMPEQLFSMNDKAFARFTIEPTAPRNVDSWSGRLFSSYARPWQVLANALAVQNPERGKECRRRASAFAPSGAPP